MDKDCHSLHLAFKSPQIRRLPTILALLFLVFASFCNELSLAWIHERVPRDISPLPDLFFSFFPEIQGTIIITEYIMLLLVSSSLLVIFLHRNRWHVARRVFFCAGLSYIFRALCITLIQVPVPSQHTFCAPKGNTSLSLVIQRVAKMFWSAGIEQLRPRELCGDLIVSGHTITIFTALLSFKQYCPRNLKPLGHLYTLLAIVALFAILLNRKHYSIDITLGYLVSSRIFMEYHSLALSYHDGSIHRNPLWSSIWAVVVPYLEKDAPPPHLFLNQLECPSQCIQRLTNMCSSKTIS